MAQVCILTTVHNPLNTRVYHKEARAAVEAGHEVSMIAHNVPTNNNYDVEFYSLGTTKNRFQRWSHIPRTYAIARNMDADIYHFHDPELLPVGVLLAQQTDARVIYDAHEDYGYTAITYREWIPSVIRPSIAKVFPWCQSTLANRLDAVITTTDSTAEQFRDLGHPHVEVIHNYPKTNNIIFDTPEIQPNEGITLVYVGTLEPARGIFAMLNLVRELVERGENVELWLVGTFSDNMYRQKYDSYINKYNIKNNVRSIGFVPYEQIFSYLKAGDVGLSLLDSKLCEHNLPTKIFEYMYAKTPVIATKSQSVQPYLTNEVGYIVDKTDSEEQADVIQEWRSDPQQLNKMGEKARKLVEQKYNWEKEANKLQSLYASLI
jgi:glycosyltransferase involved in cell wall biosynthesis